MLLKYDITSTEYQGLDLEKLNSNSASALFYTQRHNYKIIETRIVQSTVGYSTEHGVDIEWRLEIKCEQIADSDANQIEE